jgi:hypothetical protein
VQEPNEIAAHLGTLATELRSRGLDARVITKGPQPYVKAANPNTPELNERVLCRRADDDSLCFWWPWQQPIGSVDDLETVADKITEVLRSVESQP